MKKTRIVLFGALLLAVGALVGSHADEKNALLVKAANSSALDSYYGTSFDWVASGATLKTSLFNKIGSHTSKGYAAIWSAYQTTDVDADGKIWDMYSTKRWAYSTEQCGTYSVEGDCYNREHTIPQSIFAEASPMVCDVHHLFPTDGKVNGMRSNYPHGFVSSPTYTSGNGSKLGGGNSSWGYTGTCFEPIDEYKGDFARAYFYFVTCYQDRISSYSYDSFAGNSYPSLSSWAINTYLDWAYVIDPVSTKEVDRNDAAFAFQGNRNPFVDHPEAAARVWDPNNSLGYFATYGSVSTTPTISMPSTASVDVGGTVSVTATLSNMTGTVSYSTDASSVATVNSSGTVTGVAVGSATITASITYEGTTYTDTCAVTVNAVTPRITVGQSTLSLSPGGSSGEVSFSTANFTGTPTVSAVSSVTGVATISVGPSSVTISPVAVGSSTVTVTATYGSETATATIDVTVAEAGTSTTILPTTTNMPIAYPATPTTYSLEGLDLTLDYVANYSGIIQFKANQGYMLNSAPLNSISSLVVVYNSLTATSIPTVTCGFSPSLGTTATPDISGSTYTYALGGATYFKILANTNAGKISSLTFNFGAPSKTLSSIEVTTLPSKTTYSNGETLDFDGLVITARYSDGSSESVAKASCTFSPAEGSTLSTPGTNTITTSFTFGGKTETCTFDVTLESSSITLASIAVTSPPTKNAYYVGETLDISGLVVTGTYSNSSTANVTSSCTLSPTSGSVLNNAGSLTVLVTFLDRATTFNVTVTATGGENTYHLITNVTGLISGSRYLICTAKTGLSFVMGSTCGTDYYNKVDYTFSTDQTINLGTGMLPLTLGGSMGAWTFGDTVNTGYLNTTAAKNLTHKPTASTWTIAIAGTGVATITCTTGTYGSILYNTSAPRFTTYTSGQTPVYLYVQESGSSDASATEASSWAATFVAALNPHCDVAQQASASPDSALQTTWADESSSYASLSSGAKSMLSASSPTDSSIVAAQNLYRFILSKYGTAALTNFLGLTIAPSIGGTVIVTGNEEAALLVAAAVTALCLSGFYFLRKRKMI